MASTNIKDIVDGLLDLQDKYAHVFRAITTKERFNNIINSGLVPDINYDDEFLREPLLEHVGHLPVIASYLYPYIENNENMDLGRTLIMLSIHDIGETVTGDVLTFEKTAEHEKEEYDAVKNILGPRMLEIFNEYEARKSLEAKYAKSVDAMAPLLHELSIPEVTVERFEHYDFDIVKIDAAKRQYFEWDKVIMDVFEELMGRYEREVKKGSN